MKLRIMIHLQVHALVTLLAVGLDLCVVVGPSTPSLFYSDFSAKLWSQLQPDEVHLRLISHAEVETSDSLEHCATVLLATREISVTTQVLKAAQSSRKTVLSLSLSHRRMRENSVHIDDASAIPYLESTLRHFNWTRIALCYGPNSFGTALRERIDRSFASTQTLITPNDRNQTISRLIATEIKKQGENIIVVGTEADAVPGLFAQLKEDKLMRDGYAFIVVGEAVWGQQWTQWPGILLLKEAECLQANTLFECDADRVAQLVKTISSVTNSQICDLTADHFNEYFAANRPNAATDVVVVNTNYGPTRVVGVFDASMKFVQTEAIYFPGNKTTLPILSRTTVEISFNSGLSNPTTPPTTVAASFYRGQELAALHINSRTDVLPTKILVTNAVSFGASEWNETWATPRILANKDRMGVAYMAGYASEVTLYTLRAFAKLSMSHPSISSSNSIYALGNSTEFPLFVRNGLSDPYVGSQFLKLMLVMGWKHCAVLYGDDLWASSVYSWLEKLAQAQQITILNNQTFRRLPGRAPKEVYRSQYREHLLELFRCNARFIILILLEPVPQYILELMFDLGARKGDFVFTGAWLPSNYANKGKPAGMMKYRELLEGTVGIMPAAWVGQVGQTVRTELLNLYGDGNPGPFTCYYYDSTFAIAHAIDSCIEYGHNYENPFKLMKCLRETRFMGCTGLVSWAAGDNDRVIYEYAILNLVRNESSGEYQLLEVGQYQPMSTQLFNFSVTVKFPDGSAIPPSDLRVVYVNCPFEEKNRHQFPRGRTLAIGICAIVATVSSILALLIYKKGWSKVVPKMKKKELSVEDVMFMLAIGTEAVQLACIGPDFHSLNSFLMNSAQLLTVDLTDIIAFTKGVYWVALDVVLGIVGLWICLNVFMFCRVEERLEKCGCVRAIGRIASFTLPQLASVCFVPILFITMDVYICDEAVGYGSLKFSDSILARDCYVRCWRGTHLAYVVIVSVGLLIYVPSAILLRPVWQGHQDNLHIKTYPLAIVLKSLVQVFLVALSKTGKRWAESVSGGVFLCTVTVYMLLSCKYRPYNYSRVCLWHNLSLLGVIILSLVSVINNTLYPDPNIRLVVFVVVCWTLLIGTIQAAVGLWIQHRYLPSMLYRKPRRDLSKLLRFAFTNQVSVSEIQPQLNLVQSTNRPVSLSDVSFNISSQ